MRTRPLACLAAAGILLAAGHAWGQVTAQAVDTKNRRLYRLENKLLRLTFNPASYGGGATDALFRPAARYMSGRGLFSENLPGFTASMEAEVVESSDDRGAIRLTRRGAKPPLWNLRFSRTITLERASAAVRVEMSVTNEGKTPLRFAVRPFSGVKFTGRDENPRYTMPSDSGVLVSLDHAPQPDGKTGGQAGSAVLLKDTVAGWIGARSASGVAVAATFDWSVLDMSLCRLDTIPGVIMEWGYNEIELKPGETFTTAYTWTFLKDMGLIHGASDDVAVGIDLPEEVKPGQPLPVRVSVGSGHALDAVELTVSVRTLLERTGRPVGREVFALEPGLGRGTDVQVTLTHDATHVIEAVVARNGRVLCRGERVVTLGKSAHAYAAERPAGPKRGKIYWTREPEKVLTPDTRPLPAYHAELDLETVTPHTKLMKPNARGTVRVLYVSRADYFKYSVREMHQRFDLDTDFLLFFRKARVSDLVLDQYRADSLSALKAALEADRCDVVHFVSLNWNWIPKELIDHLVTRVRGGMGVVLNGANKQQMEPVLKALNQAGAQKADASVVQLSSGLFRKEGAVTGVLYGSPRILMEEPLLYSLGRGRVAVLRMRGKGYYDYFLPAPLNAPGEREFPWWEHVYGAYGRAQSWAAGKDAGVVFSAMAADGNSARLALQAPEGVAVDRVRVVALDDDLNTVASCEVRPEADQVVCEWPAPLLQSRYTLDAVALDEEGRSLGFGQARFTVGSRLKIQVRLEPDRCRGDERPVAFVTITAPEPLTATVTAELVDTFGRRVWSAASPARLGPQASGFSWDLKGARTVTIGHRFRATVRAAGADVARVERELRIFPAEPPVAREFVGLVWGTPEYGPYARRLLQGTRDSGIDFFYAAAGMWRRTNALLGVDLNLSFWGMNVGETIQKHFKLDATTGHSVRCPWDEAELRKLADDARKDAKLLTRELAVDHYILQDEYWITPLLKDRSPITLAAFRRYLKGLYPSLTALNTQWETAYDNWEKVGFPPEKNVSAESDWQAFWCGLLNLRIKTARDAIRQVNPRARVGLSGTQRPVAGRGYDYPELMKVADFIVRYNDLQGDLMQSFGSADLRVGRWQGYRTEGGASFTLWDSLLHGARFVAFFKLMANPHRNVHYGFLDQNLRVRPFNRLLGEELRRVRSGLGRLILACRPEFDPIAIYHSQRTNLSTGLAAYPFKRLIEDAGFRFTFVDSRDVAAGALAHSTIKALFLPQITCMTAEERDALRAFVEAGGVLIADQACGVRDGHAKPLRGGMLDDLFGLRRTAEYRDANRVDHFAATDAAGPRTRGYRALQLAVAQQGLVPGPGRAWLTSEKDIPAVIVNRVGRGAAVYLNLDFSNYAASAAGGTFGEVTKKTQGAGEYVESCIDLLRRLLDDLAGLRPVAAVRVDGRMVWPATTSRFRRGNLRLVAFLTSQGRPERIAPEHTRMAEFDLPGPGHVYELRTEGRPFGRTDRVRAKLTPCIPTLFALLPYEVTGVKLNVSAAERGRVARVEGVVTPAGRATPEDHVVRVEAFRPDGSRFDAFCENVLTKDGRFVHELPLAQNDPTGMWRVTARDVISGKSAEATMPLR